LNLLFNQLIQLQPKIRGMKICKNSLVLPGPWEHGFMKAWEERI
jgi:hypothetical protein